MNRIDRVAVASRSFSRNPVLRNELLQRYEHVTFNDAGLQLEGQALINFLRGHDKAITALERLNEAVFEQLPELKVIGKYGVGLDMIDISAMRRLGRRLGWTGGVNRRSVSELVIAATIALLRHLPVANAEVRAGTWRQHVGNYLSGRTVGIIGCGNIGRDLVQLLQPFGCPVLVNDIRHDEAFYREYDIDAVSMEELLQRSDVVTLHVPLDDSTRDMLTAQRISLMRPSAILVNAARGCLVDEAALKSALLEKRLAAAYFDVFANEPPEDTELLNLPNFLVTPHIGGSAVEAILAMGRAAIEGLDINDVP
jgi:D-3-phosphoglycerate dehydrogenase